MGINLDSQRDVPGLWSVQQASADAEAIEAPLADPPMVLGEDPFPTAPAGVGRLHEAGGPVRSPIAGWTSDQRLVLGTALREQFVGAPRQT